MRLLIEKLLDDMNFVNELSSKSLLESLSKNLKVDLRKKKQELDHLFYEIVELRQKRKNLRRENEKGKCLRSNPSHPPSDGHVDEESTDKSTHLPSTRNNVTLLSPIPTTITTTSVVTTTTITTTTTTNSTNSSRSNLGTYHHQSDSHMKHSFHENGLNKTKSSLNEKKKLSKSNQDHNFQAKTITTSNSINTPITAINNSSNAHQLLKSHHRSSDSLSKSNNKKVVLHNDFIQKTTENDHRPVNHRKIENHEHRSLNGRSKSHHNQNNNNNNNNTTNGNNITVSGQSKSLKHTKKFTLHPLNYICSPTTPTMSTSITSSSSSSFSSSTSSTIVHNGNSRMMNTGRSINSTTSSIAPPINSSSSGIFKKKLDESRNGSKRSNDSKSSHHSHHQQSSTLGLLSNGNTVIQNSNNNEIKNERLGNKRTKSKGIRTPSKNGHIRKVDYERRNHLKKRKRTVNSHRKHSFQKSNDQPIGDQKKSDEQFARKLRAQEIGLRSANN
ncbi:hypothetical protein SNEBB_001218 [Seison nebaliae]|nr:hypothetical protein SNEBB_001218 [Seison nebaliae]